MTMLVLCCCSTRSLVPRGWLTRTIYYLVVLGKDKILSDTTTGAEYHRRRTTAEYVLVVQQPSTPGSKQAKPAPNARGKRTVSPPPPRGHTVECHSISHSYTQQRHSHGSADLSIITSSSQLNLKPCVRCGYAGTYSYNSCEDFSDKPCPQRLNVLSNGFSTSIVTSDEGKRAVYPPVHPPVQQHCCTLYY